MTNFLRLAGILLNQGPWGAWSSERRSKSNKKFSKDKAKTDEKNPKSDGNNSNSDGSDPDDNDKNKEKEREEEVKEVRTEEENKTIVGPWGSTNKESDKNTNITEQKKYEGLIKDLVEGHSQNRKKNGSNGGSGSNGGDFFDKLSKSPKKALMLIALIAASLWLATGFYKVDSDENALVLYFGKYHTIATPGLNYRIPYPVGRVVKQSVTTVNSEEFGYKTRSTATRRFGSRTVNNQPDNSENLMLTGDENIVDIEFQVQWQIKDIEKFTFNISEPRLTIRKAAESAMREVIAVTPISEALSDGKSHIERDAKVLLQKTLDDYGAGIRIVLLQLRRVDPPAQVIDSFRDVQTAKADKEKEINEAQAYANDIIPRARGNAAQMQEQAMAYKSRVTSDAQGEAKRFLALYGQYKKAKEVTRRRIYLKTMQKVYGDIDKVIIDDKLSKSSLMPYFPLGDLNKGKK